MTKLPIKNYIINQCQEIKAWYRDDNNNRYKNYKSLDKLISNLSIIEDYDNLPNIEFKSEIERNYHSKMRFRIFAIGFILKDHNVYSKKILKIVTGYLKKYNLDPLYTRDLNDDLVEYFLSYSDITFYDYENFVNGFIDKYNEMLDNISRTNLSTLTNFDKDFSGEKGMNFSHLTSIIENAKKEIKSRVANDNETDLSKTTKIRKKMAYLLEQSYSEERLSSFLCDNFADFALINQKRQFYVYRLMQIVYFKKINKIINMIKNSNSDSLNEKKIEKEIKKYFIPGKYANDPIHFPEYVDKINLKYTYFTERYSKMISKLNDCEEDESDVSDIIEKFILENLDIIDFDLFFCKNHLENTNYNEYCKVRDKMADILSNYRNESLHKRDSISKLIIKDCINQDNLDNAIKTEIERGSLQKLSVQFGNDSKKTRKYIIDKLCGPVMMKEICSSLIESGTVSSLNTLYILSAILKIENIDEKINSERYSNTSDYNQLLSIVNKKVQRHYNTDENYYFKDIIMGKNTFPINENIIKYLFNEIGDITQLEMDKIMEHCGFM